jgi:molecular chaperone HtpG
MDKLYYKARTEHIGQIDRDTLAIDLEIDTVQRTLTVRDNGCGMTKEELETNLGTIAGSGTRAFRGQLEQGEQDVEMIGQFGVGFYSAFMVADHIEVTSRAFGSDEAFCWVSDGADGFTVSAAQKAQHGTEIVLHIRPAEGEDSYDEFLQPHRIAGIVRKYSDYIRYPIRMEMEQTRLKEGSEDQYETVSQVQTLNSMVPLWRKNKSEITSEQYNDFYKNKFYDFTDPLRVIHSSTEGAATYNALLFLPARKPYNYYSREYEKGLQLYAGGVLIMEKCADLLPDYFSFVRGLVDSQDLSLNISREMLQHDRQLKLIATHLEKEIHTELTAMLNNDREKYEAFFAEFGLQLKYGVYGDYGRNKDRLKDLLLFTSSYEDKPVTLQEYVGRMKEDQKVIYYACGETAEKIRRLPQTEWLLDRGYELLLLTEDVDEFTVKALHDWDG